ncbi:MAG: hypothetical protein ACYDEP_09280 [Acidimicrobiales bacterium]
MAIISRLKETSAKRAVAYAATAGVVALGAIAGAFWIGGPASGANGRRPGVVTTAAAFSSKPLNTVTPVTTATYNLTLSATLESGKTVTVTGNGQVDFANDSASSTLSVPPLLAVGGGTGSTSSNARIDVQVVLVGGTLYATVPGITTLFAGTPWVSYALPKRIAANEPARFEKAARSLADVGGVLNYVDVHGGKVSPLGTKTINGVTATGYDANVNVANILGSYPAIPKRLVTRVLHVVGANVGVTLYEDSSGRLVQLSSSISRANPAKHGLKSVSIVLNVGGYGSPVSIVAPPAASTTPLSPAMLNSVRSLVRSSVGDLGLRHGRHNGHGHRHGHRHAELCSTNSPAPSCTRMHRAAL